jgi:MSHA biogenesis protein MshO
MKRTRCQGFTMVELVVSMVIAAIVAGFVAMMMTTPVDAFIAQSRRAELSDAAETAMRRISTDVRRALPDSLRAGVINGAASLDLMEVSAATSYRQWTTGDPLTINAAPDDGFDAAGAQLTARPLDRLVVGHIRNDVNFDAYAAASTVITPVGTSIAYDVGTRRFSISPAHSFPRDPSSQRAYAIAGVTRYECDTAAGVLRRYDGLPVEAAMNPIAAPVTVIARDITACSFRVLDSTAEHGGIAIVEMTVSRAAGGNVERLRVVRQIRVENTT